MAFVSWPGLTKSQTLTDENTLKRDRYWFHEKIQGKDKLVVAVGDSWTWGDSLFGINAKSEYYDDPRRVNVIYGSLLANMFDADFVNIGHCGGNNADMISRTDTLLSHNINNYKEIYTVITMTENCRELKFPPKRPDWIDSKSLYSLTEFLKSYEQRMFDSIENLIKKYDQVKFLVGRNFSYSFQENIRPWHLEKTWVDCLAEAQNIRYPDDVRFISRMSFLPIQDFFKHYNIFENIKEQFITEYDKALSAINWLEISQFNHKKDTKHPTLEGHQIWAKYLFDNFNHAKK